MTNPTQVRLVAPADLSMVELLGEGDHLLKIVEDQFESDITVRGNEITITGDATEAQAVSAVFTELFDLIAAGESLTAESIDRAIDMLRRSECSPSSIFADVILTHRGKTIRPKTAGQKRYVDVIRESTVTFGIGPAGTGKTYLAMAMAVDALRKKEVGRIILTRPAVEAGEKLGYLPGTLYEKVDPYLRPLYDALFDMMDIEKSTALTERGVIEVAPLAFMRGRTLNDSFVILDEAQNTTPEQMKMFLTRLGFGSKIVVTGDVTQTDLIGGLSGLLQVRNILGDVKGVGFVELEARDVVRHRLVQRIVTAYHDYEESQCRRASDDDA
ncbi:PhoH family protein [Anaerosoma tenue]|uniref:PhoH family protein n=1 Tax=Anaerosoma tenue TaxID=2933588 RepID=UPI000B1EC193|nr:PhoH family protein [Anaerosoma tenue]MCK8114054.1 PhoH family protein [Anaerosoma tenue]